MASSPPSPRNCADSAGLRVDEFARIAAFFAPLATHPGAWGLRDDAAELPPPSPGHRLVITQDTLVESVHFLGDELPSLLARKALRVNLSDLAAKGAKPLGYLLSLSLPARCDDAWLAAFSEGLRADQEVYGLSLFGGDSTSSPDRIVITITAWGETHRIVRRSGAQPGDLLFVTGVIGAAHLGLLTLRGQADAGEAAQARYHLPEPRLAFANAVAAHAHASLDVSDGLLQDAAHLARESGLCVTLALESIPLFDPQGDALAQITGGDDYEILFSAPESARNALETLAKSTKTPLFAIGSCTEGKGLRLTRCGEAVALPPTLGWKHF